MTTNIPEIAENLALACLEQEHFALHLVEDVDKAEEWGQKVGEFYKGIYASVKETLRLE